MGNKITKLIRPCIISLFSISILFAMSTVHATAVNGNGKERDIYHDERYDEHIFAEKLAALFQQVEDCDTLKKEEQALLERLQQDQASNSNPKLNDDTIIPYKTADVFKKVATFAEQGGIWTTNDLSALEKEFISSLIMTKATEVVHDELGKNILLFYKAIRKENVAIVALLKKIQIKAIVAPLSSEEQSLLNTLLKELPYQAVDLLKAVDNYITDEYAYDFTSIDDCIVTLEEGKEALLLYLGKAKAFFTGKIKGLKSGNTKVVNSLLQLICLEGRADAALITFLNSHLEGYDLHIEKVKPTEKGASPFEQAMQQTQLNQEKLLTATEKKITQALLAKIATHEYLQMKMAYFIALLNDHTGHEEALEEAIHKLQYAFKSKIKYQEAPSPFLIDKVVNTLLCCLVDTYASDKKVKENEKVKELESIQALYIAKFRFKLLETIHKSLEEKNELKKWLGKLNTSEEAIAIEEIITLDIAETLMKLDTFMKKSPIEREKKQHAIKEILQSLQHLILLTCKDRFNAIKQQIMQKPINKHIQQLGAHIWQVGILSSIMKGKNIKEDKKNIRQICSQKVQHIKDYLYSCTSNQDKQAGVKKMLKQIQTTLSEQISQFSNPKANNKPIKKLQKNEANTVSIGGKVYSQTANSHDLTNLAELKKWFGQLKKNIQAQTANILPLLALLLIIVLEYYKKLERTKIG